jgi:mono/diheme cytochrome c family protein
MLRFPELSSGLSIAASVMIALIVHAAPPEPAAQEGSAEHGKVIYDQWCLSCHGPQGKGDGPEAPFLSPRPGSLLSAATSVKTDAELLGVITNGKLRTAMPAWKDRLTEQQRLDVLAYVRSLIRFHRSLTPPPPSSEPNTQK